MIMVYKGLGNKNQLEALFILSLFRQSTSTCFGRICSQSSGGILYIYIYITIGTCCDFQLTVCWPVGSTDSAVATTYCNFYNV